MSILEHSIDVDVPVHVAYNQWTQFESFPRFMDGVERVDRPQSTLTHWVMKLGNMTREFDAEIMEQRPDERLVWQTLDKPRHTGTVTFRPLDADHCRVTLRMDFTPHGLFERTGDTLGLVRRQVQNSLKCFKEFIEARGQETGAWRGAISGSHVQPDSGQDRPHVPTWPTG